MPTNNLTTREKARQERERTKSLANRSLQLMKKAARSQEKSRREEVTQAAARIVQEVKGKT